MQYRASNKITVDEADQILHDALDRAKEAHHEDKEGCDRELPPITGGPTIGRSSGVQTASMKEYARAAARYSDFLMYGKIPDDLKAKDLSRKAGR